MGMAINLKTCSQMQNSDFLPTTFPAKCPGGHSPEALGRKCTVVKVDLDVGQPLVITSGVWREWVWFNAELRSEKACGSQCKGTVFKNCKETCLGVFS
jgi:hypothetical protein